MHFNWEYHLLDDNDSHPPHVIGDCYHLLAEQTVREVHSQNIKLCLKQRYSHYNVCHSLPCLGALPRVGIRASVRT